MPPRILNQGVYQTLETLNDPKFGLVTPRNVTLNSTKFELNDLENPGNYPQEILIH